MISEEKTVERIPVNVCLDGLWTTFQIEQDDFLKLQKIYDKGKEAMEKENED